MCLVTWFLRDELVKWTIQFDNRKTLKFLMECCICSSGSIISEKPGWQTPDKSKLSNPVLCF